MYELILLVLGIAFVVSHRGTRARIMALEADISKLRDQLTALQQASAPVRVETTEAVDHAVSATQEPPALQAEDAAATREVAAVTEAPATVRLTHLSPP